MKTKVVNLHGNPYDVYIGRGKGKSGYFGNPYPVLLVGRIPAIAQYEKYFRARIAADPGFKKRILELAGKRLGCFCKPLACHGDVIVKWLEEN